MGYEEERVLFVSIEEIALVDYELLLVKIERWRKRFATVGVINGDGGLFDDEELGLIMASGVEIGAAYHLQ